MNKQTTETSLMKTALITGASSGIGMAFAERLARDRHDLIIVARRREKLEEIAREIEKEHSVAVEVLPADLSIDKGVTTVINRVENQGHIDMVVNNAGFGTRGHFANVDPKKSADMVYLHNVAAVRITRAALPGMIQAGRGSVLFTSSLGAFFTTAEYVTYSATKAFLNMFTKGLHEELRGTGVRVLAFCPGLTDTGFLLTDEFSGFDYDRVPGWMKYPPEKVVDEAIRALKKDKVIRITGFGNRFFVGILRAPIIGWIIGNLIQFLNRKMGGFY